MTCDEISRMGVDELRRDLRTARRQLATALDLVRTLNAELDAMMEAEQGPRPCPNCTCSDCLPPEYLANLQAELTDLERTHPDVKAAAESYDAMVQTLPVIPKGRMTLITSEPDEPP